MGVPIFRSFATSEILSYAFSLSAVFTAKLLSNAQEVGTSDLLYGVLAAGAERAPVSGLTAAVATR